MVASDTQITLNGKQARLSDLRSRYAATIWAETKGAEPVAKYIHAALRL